MPLLNRVDWRIWWLTVSKAADRSSNISNEDLEAVLVAKQAQTLTRDAIQFETKRDFSKSKHRKQNKRFLATATALNTNETSQYTYELLLTSADRLLLSKIITEHRWCEDPIESVLFI